MHTHALGDHATLFQWFGEHPLLPLGVAGHGAELLIGGVQGAKAVAVHEDRISAVKIDYGAFVEQGAAAGSRKVVAEHEIPVAVHEVELAAAVGKLAEGGDGIEIEGGVIIVADPGFEQVAQYIQGIGFAGMFCQQLFQGIQMLRACRIQVQIRDEKGVTHDY